MILRKTLCYEEWKEIQINQGQRGLKYYPQIILLDKAIVSWWHLTRTKSAKRKTASHSLFLHVSDTCMINSAFVIKTESLKHWFFYDLLKLVHIVRQTHFKDHFQQTISEEKYSKHIKNHSYSVVIGIIGFIYLGNGFYPIFPVWLT